MSTQTMWHPYAYVEENNVIVKCPTGARNSSARMATELLLKLIFEEKT